MFVAPFLLAASFFLPHTRASGFDFPTALEPALLSSFSVARGPLIPPLSAHETPVTLRLTNIVDDLIWNCIVVYHTTGNDANTLLPPVVRDPMTSRHTPENQLLCALYAEFIAMPVLITSTLPVLEQIATTYGLTPNFEFDAAVVTCDAMANGAARDACLAAYVVSQGYIPEAMGQLVASQLLRYTADDGYNAFGKYSHEYNKNLRSGSRHNPKLNCPTSMDTCTANCKPYTDTVGYYPERAPWDKVTSKNRESWEPLQETNNLGYFVRQEHITPHIGCRVTPKSMTRAAMLAMKAPDPDYDYDEEAELTVERMAELATNDTMKMLVELFDNKIAVGVGVGVNLMIQYPNLTYAQIQWGVLGYSAAEYDSTILAWKEKVRWDLIRPTTVIKRWGDDVITTWAGPYQGVGNIEAKDFQAYFRVMPHSEYPSGSACLCTAIAGFMDLYMQSLTDDDSLSVTFEFPEGSSRIEPGVTPASDITYTFPHMSELARLCGQSRLWGGIHFTTAVSAGEELCADVGQGAFDYALSVMSLSDLLAS